MCPRAVSTAREHGHHFDTRFVDTDSVYCVPSLTVFPAVDVKFTVARSSHTATRRYILRMFRVKGQGHHGQKTAFSALSEACVRFMFGAKFHYDI